MAGESTVMVGIIIAAQNEADCLRFALGVMEEVKHTIVEGGTAITPRVADVQMYLSPSGGGEFSLPGDESPST